MYIYIYKDKCMYTYIWLRKGSGTRVNGSHSIPGLGTSFFEYGNLFIDIIGGGDQ